MRGLKNRQKGITLLETALSLGILVVVMASLTEMMVESAATVRNKAVAEQMIEVRDAAQNYLEDNWGTIDTALPAVGNQQEVNITGPSPSLIADGYLSSTVNNFNAYGHRYRYFIKKTAASELTGMIVSEKQSAGEQDIALDDQVEISTFIGGEGGFITDNDLICGDPAVCFAGTFGGWRIQTASNWDSGGWTANDGLLASKISLNTQTFGEDFLYRVAVPGHPELNIMMTDLDMNNNDINNVQNAGIFDLTVGNSAVVTGDVTAEDLVLSQNGNQEVSEGIYFADIVASGDVVNKPTCPAGKTPSIYVSPAMFSDNGTGSTLSAVQTFAEDNGANWTARMRIRNEYNLFEPNSTYGKLLVFTKCN
jgi:type II secretory pathway pseudopilin PulG